MGGWVIFAIFIAIAVISALSHAIKGQTEPAPRRRNTNRAKPRVDRDRDREDNRDSFVAEIERLRRKAAPPAIPTVKPKSQPKRQRASEPPGIRLEQLPPATVVVPTAAAAAHALRFDGPTSSPPITVASIAPITKILEVSKPVAAGSSTAAKMASMSQTMKGAAETPFSKDLLSLLQAKKTMPMAVVLQEIFGPPKSQR